MNIAILGGGIAGLSTAIALARLGLSVQVYERRASIENLGAGIVCWPNATFVLAEFGMLDEVASVAGKVSAMRRIAANGEELGRLDIEQLNAAMSYPSLSILRADLLRILLDHVRQLEIPIHFNACASHILTAGERNCRATFTNGATIEADLILGAEGRMNSAAREFVAGDKQPVFQNFANWIGVFESSISLFDNMAILDYWGGGLRFGIVPVSNRKAYWAGGAAVSDDSSTIASTDTNYRSELQSAFRDWPDPVAAIAAQVSNQNTHKLLLYDHDPIAKWHKQNVLLIGDAAHAALPTSGQGAAQALEDAWTLARLFASTPTDLKAIMRCFTQQRSSKTAGIAIGARKLAKSLFHTDPQFCSQRNADAQRTDYQAMVAGMAKGWSVGLPIGAE